MKSNSILLQLPVVLLTIFAAPDVFSQQGNPDAIYIDSLFQRKSYPARGLCYSISGFTHATIGLGYSGGSFDRLDRAHSIAGVYGCMVEYQNSKRLQFRPFARTYHGLLLGVSFPVVTDFHKTDVGIGPEFGVGLASVSIFYRYNFNRFKDFRGYEIVLSVIPFQFPEEQ